MSLLPAPSEWSPLEEQFHTWDIVLLNPSVFGTVPMTRALGQWAAISITESHEGIRTSVEINAEEPSIPFIRELITDFLFYRDHQLLYRLRVVDSEDTLTRDAATVKFDCVSYDKLLERRILHEDWLLDDQDIDAAWRLIDYTQRKQTLGITRGTTAHGVRRQRGLDAGDDILSAINDFAQADNGFDWWIDQNLRFWAAKPRRGKHHDILWQLGGEIGEMTRVNPIEDYASLIMATGAQQETRLPRGDGTEDVYQPPDPQIVQLTTKPLGLWEYTTSDTDVITEASLVEKANWHLADKGSIRPTYKMTLEPGVWSPKVALGDVFTARISSVRVAVRVPVRIEELQIDCTADGAETIAFAVRAEEPETPEVPITDPLPQALSRATLAPAGAPNPNGRTVQRHRLDPADDLGALLRDLRRRLERASRSPGTGVKGGGNILHGEGPPDETVGSPLDYYVDVIDKRLYGPKAASDFAWPPLLIWDSGGAATTVRASSSVGMMGVTSRNIDVYGLRFTGLAAASDPLTFVIWDRTTGANALLLRMSVSGLGSNGIIEFADPVFIPVGTDWAFGLSGGNVPISQPGGPLPDPPPDYLGLFSTDGMYAGAIDSEPWTWAWQGTGARVDIQLLTRDHTAYSNAPEDCFLPTASPDTDITGEVGNVISVGAKGSLLGWRYKRLATSSTPTTFTVWTWSWRYYDPRYANIKPFPTSVLTQVTVDDTGEGTFEVRLPTPILMDPLGLDGPDSVMISAGGAGMAIDTTGYQNPAQQVGDWYNAGFGFSWYNATPGEFPSDNIPGSVYPNYYLWYCGAIMQQQIEIWPDTNQARSGSINPERDSERVELHRNVENPTGGTNFFKTDFTGLRFYESGPSHEWHPWGPGEGVPYWSTSLHYDGYSGTMHEPNDWYDEYGHEVYPDPQMWTNKYAYYAQYYDYAYTEQDADLDPRHPTAPGSYFMTYNDQSCWDDVAYNGMNAYGPRFGARVDGEDSPDQGGAGMAAEVVELSDGTTTGVARLYVIGDDGKSGSSVNCTPRVIQASFAPRDSYSDTWFNGRWSEGGMTPKGCLTPLVTAAAASATAADAPINRQFFRQMGSTTVTFAGGLGVIAVPTAMATPAVVHAQVEGVSVGGRRVAQAARTSDNAITVALDTAYDGDELIGWMVEAAVLTFGTPPPSIDVIRNPGTLFVYGNVVDYDAAGGDWPFEVGSGGYTFQDGCTMWDFTGAQVGGPFTPSGTPGTDYFQTFIWTVQRDWYLPGVDQQFRIQNPDGQFSNWQTVRWVDTVTAAVMNAKLAPLMAETVTPQDSTDLVLPPGSPGSGRIDYSNDQKRVPTVAPVARGIRATSERGKRIGGKQAREARRARQQDDLARRRPPPPETTGP